MKIAMIGQKGIPSRAGGVEIHVEELAAGLVEAGAQVDVYCRRYYCKNRVKFHRGIRLYYIPTISTKHLDAIIYTMLATVIALFRGYDVFHYHACGPSSLCWIPKLFGKKVVCTTHGMDWKRAKWGAIGQDYLKFGEKVIAKYANEIIALNEPMRSYFQNTYQRDTNVIPNGVEQPTVLEADLIREKWGLERYSYILFLGRLVPEKGVHYLVEAYKQAGIDKKLVIAGGSSHSDDYVERLAAMSIDDDNIIMTGFVAGQALEELYSNAFLYVLPSDVEGLPISLLEAMSYKRCCLISDIKENTDTSQGRAFEFIHGNIKDLCIQLQKITNMKLEDVERKGQEAAEYVKNTYRWKAVVKKTMEVYEKVSCDAKQVEAARYLETNREKYSFANLPEVCTILGVNVWVTDMEKTVKLVEEHVRQLSGQYVCVGNGHTTVTAFEEDEYRKIQNSAIGILPDGEPLSIVSRRRGHRQAQRVTGPDFMEQMFLKGQEGDGLRHFFYGGSQETLDALKKVLGEKYPALKIAGMYSPPYRALSKEEDRQAVEMINETEPDIVWVGLGAPKQERWMYEHQGSVHGLMFGVGAGFDYHAGKLKRAPMWMQKMSLEWLMRLLQDPRRLWKRYLVTNVKFLWYVNRENRKGKTRLETDRQ